MLKKPDLCYATSGHRPAGGTPKSRSVREAFTRKEKMTNYVLFLLEADAAKRRLAELFESETFRSADRQTTAIVHRDRSRAARTTVEKNNNAFREYRCTRTPA